MINLVYLFDDGKIEKVMNSVLFNILKIMLFVLVMEYSIEV